MHLYKRIIANIYICIYYYIFIYSTDLLIVDKQSLGPLMLLIATVQRGTAICLLTRLALLKQCQSRCLPNWSLCKVPSCSIPSWKLCLIIKRVVLVLTSGQEYRSKMLRVLQWSCWGKHCAECVNARCQTRKQVAGPILNLSWSEPEMDFQVGAKNCHSLSIHSAFLLYSLQWATNPSSPGWNHSRWVRCGNVVQTMQPFQKRDELVLHGKPNFQLCLKCLNNLNSALNNQFAKKSCLFNL
jgi:hypothetical protein